MVDERERFNSIENCVSSLGTSISYLYQIMSVHNNYLYDICDKVKHGG